tara:strand:- start:1990 stop:2220 length:231 start_codon:yes stop_codon:yes gene_type:complete
MLSLSNPPYQRNLGAKLQRLFRAEVDPTEDQVLRGGLHQGWKALVQFDAAEAVPNALCPNRHRKSSLCGVQNARTA